MEPPIVLACAAFAAILLYVSPLMSEEEAKTSIPSLESRLIAEWKTLGTGAAASYLMASLLEENGEGSSLFDLYPSILVYILTVDADSETPTPPLNLRLTFSINEPTSYFSALQIFKQKDTSVACSYIPVPTSVWLPYTGERDLQIHRCFIPRKVLAAAAKGYLDLDDFRANLVLRGVVSCPTMSSLEVQVVLRRWDPRVGHEHITEKYNYTIATVLKSHYQRCISGKYCTTEGRCSDGTFCDKPLYQRLPEWVGHHLLVGVQHIYIYCTDTWTETYQILRPFINQGLVSVIAMPELSFIKGVEGIQVVGYSLHLERYRLTSQYMLFSDADEFLYINPMALGVTLGSPNVTMNQPMSYLSTNLQNTNTSSTASGWRRHAYALRTHETLLSRMVRRETNANVDAVRKDVCNILLSWWSVSPEVKEEAMSAKSVIRAYRVSPRDERSVFNFGMGKTISRVKYASEYSNQHIRTAKKGSYDVCKDIMPFRFDAFLAHYRMQPKKGNLKNGVTKFRKMERFYPFIEQLLANYSIW